jgi:hypothetical protein
MKRSVGKQLPIKVLQLDGGTQMRPLCTETVNRYVSLMSEGVEFPPIEVAYDGKNYWVIDGFHRVTCHERLERPTILANVRQTSLLQARWLACAANSQHGLARQPGVIAYILAKVIRLDEKMRSKPPAEIARHVGCSRAAVYKYVLGEEEKPPDEPESQESATSGAQDIDLEYDPKHPLKDCIDQEIPQDRVDRWLARSKVQKHIAKLDDIKRAVSAGLEGDEWTYALLSQGAFNSAIAKLKDVLTNAQPYALCATCKGKGCERCHRMGFVNRAQAKMKS